MVWTSERRTRLLTRLRSEVKALRLSRAGSWLASAITRLAVAGTAGYPPDVKRRLMILNMVAYLVAITTLIYAVQQMSLDFERYRPVILINAALIPLMLAVPFLHRFSDIAAAMLIVVAECSALLAFVAYLGRSSGLQIQYIVLAAAPFVVLGLNRLWLILPIIMAAAALHLIAWFWFPRSVALIAAEREVLDALYVQATITTFGLIAASVYYAFSLVETAKAETDALLRNILPDSIVERLKEKPTEAIADNFTEASILFADISGFVALARRLGAGPTVELLNHIVSRFDALSAKHGVEKIKTIGDAYMVASGIPEPRVDHAQRLARMGLDMQAVIAELRDELGLELSIRIGLATGPVMAGVIGKRKFSYDVWGDAVNLAARLENLSLPGRIHICPKTREALEVEFELESRGAIDIKGVGQEETWFLVGPRRAEASQQEGVTR